MFAGVAPYFLIGFGAIFGILPGAILLGSAICAAVKRDANVAKTHALVRERERQGMPLQTVATF